MKKLDENKQTKHDGVEVFKRQLKLGGWIATSFYPLI